MKFDRNLWSILVLVAVNGIVFLLGPRIYTNPSFFFTMMMYTSLALGFNLIYGFTGYLPLGYVTFFAVGGYGFAIGVHFGYGIPISILLGILFSILIGLVFTPMLKLRGMYFALANLAAFEAVYYSMSTSNLTPITQGGLGIAMPQIYNPTLVTYSAFALLIAAILTTVWVKRSTIGLALLAIRDNQSSAAHAGINVPIMRTIAWFLGVTIASFAGILYAWYIVFIYPETLFSLSFMIFLAVFAIFGGLRTVWGPIIGTFVLYSVYNFVGITYSSYFSILFGCLLIILALFLSGGLNQIIRHYWKQGLP